MHACMVSKWTFEEEMFSDKETYYYFDGHQFEVNYGAYLSIAGALCDKEALVRKVHNNKR